MPFLRKLPRLSASQRKPPGDRAGAAATVTVLEVSDQFARRMVAVLMEDQELVGAASGLHPVRKVMS